MTKRDANAQSFKPKWPDRTSLTADQVRFTYDRPTDTLFVDFHGQARPAASIPVERGDRDYLFLRLDPDTEAVVGLQIEHFLSYAIEQHPELVGALDVATLVGIDREELDRIIHLRFGRPRAGNSVVLIEDLLRLSASCG